MAEGPGTWRTFQHHLFITYGLVLRFQGSVLDMEDSAVNETDKNLSSRDLEEISKENGHAVGGRWAEAELVCGLEELMGKFLPT